MCKCETGIDIDFVWRIFAARNADTDAPNKTTRPAHNFDFWEAGLRSAPSACEGGSERQLASLFSRIGTVKQGSGANVHIDLLNKCASRKRSGENVNRPSQTKKG